MVTGDWGVVRTSVTPRRLGGGCLFSAVRLNEAIDMAHLMGAVAIAGQPSSAPLERTMPRRLRFWDPREPVTPFESLSFTTSGPSPDSRRYHTTNHLLASKLRILIYYPT
jgi:hypothetical protein